MAYNTRSSRPGKDKDTDPVVAQPARKPATESSNIPVKDPTAKVNWGVEPTSSSEMENWIDSMGRLILRYLEFYKEKAENSDKRSQKDSLDTALKAKWAKWESETDIATGEIFNSERKRLMQQAMRDTRNEAGKAYFRNRNANAIDNYKSAQEVWEDFLYYQNAWNRPRTNDLDDVRGPRYACNPRMSTAARKSFERRNKTALWRENMIRLYNEFNVGDRNNLPNGGIGPDRLHRYPDNIRKTTKSEVRLPHLDEQFPTSDLRLNCGAIAVRREDVERKRNKEQQEEADIIDEAKYAVTERLPADHQVYHAATEYSNPWQYQGRRVHTSWESNTWGPVVASKKRVLSNERHSERPYYQKLKNVPFRITEMGTVFDAHRNRTRDNANGGWVQAIQSYTTFDDTDELDENDQRIPLPGPLIYDTPTYTPAGIVTEASAQNRTFTARREHYPNTAPQKDAGDSLSDAETADYGEDDVPLLHSGREPDGNPSDEEESDDDEDEDPFTRSYKKASGLPVRPRTGGDGPGGGGPPGGGDDPSDDGGGPSKGDDGLTGNGDDLLNDSDEHMNDEDEPTNNGDGSTNKGDEPSSDSDGDEGGNPKPSGGGTKKKQPKKIQKDKASQTTVLFEDILGENLRRVTTQHTYPNGWKYKQIDVVPALRPDADELLDSNNEPVIEVLPKDAMIPNDRKYKGDKYKGIKWKLQPDGTFTKDFPKEHLVWRPSIVQRKFRTDTGECVGCSEPFAEMEKLLESELQDGKLVDSYNKKTRQYQSRNDTTAKKNLGSHPRWSQEEIAEMVRVINDFVRQHGVGDVIDKKKTFETHVRNAINKLRKAQNLEDRGGESIRTKLNRVPGLEKKLVDFKTKKANNTLTAADTRPADFLELADFDAPAGSKKSGGGKTKRVPPAKAKGKWDGKGKGKGRAAPENMEDEEDGGDEEDQDEDEDAEENEEED